MDGEYAPSPSERVRDQVARFEQSNGSQANTLRDTGLPIVVVTHRGQRTGKVRKTPLLRIEHEGTYLLVASHAGAPSNPAWYANLRANPSVEIQDGANRRAYLVHLAEGEERATWWRRAVGLHGEFAIYEASTERVIPLFVAEPS